MNRREFLARANAGFALGGATVRGTASDPGIANGRGRRSRSPETAETSGRRDTYRNPVYDRVFPDPDALRVDGTYYAYSTFHPWTEGEGPDRELISVLRSPDLANWEAVGPAFRETPDWSRYRGLWAPAVGRFGDRFVLYYSDSEFGADDPGIGVATAENPAGPFRPRGGLFRSREIGVENSIDPALFVRNGTPYLFWGSHRGLYGIRLAEDGLSTASADEKFRVAGEGVEAAYAVERGDYFYLFGSRGTCCRGAESTYRVVVGRARNLPGPYRNRDGERLADGATGTVILRGDETFAAPGHCAVVRDANGGWWLLYHAYERETPWVGDTPRRVLLLDRIRWSDGWPEVGDGTPSEEGRVPPVEGRGSPPPNTRRVHRNP